MRKISLILIFAFQYYFCNAENIALEIGRSYKFTATTVIEECDIVGSGFGINILTLAGSKFTVINIVGNNYLIKFWNWDGLNPKQKPNYDKYNFAPIGTEIYGIASTTIEQRFFLISKDNLTTNICKMIESRFDPVFGAIILPFKLRFKSLDFTKDFGFSALGGAKYNFNKLDGFSIQGVVGFGISDVTLDSTNTNGKIMVASDRPAITIPFGIVFEYKRLQLAVLSGVDILAKKNKDEWIYNGKPWLAFGIGYTIFQGDRNKNVKEGTN